MTDKQTNNPLHGITLERVVAKLQEHYGWEGLAQRVNINCFKSDPSVKSSLKFLRKTQWARDKVEQLYLSTFEKRTAKKSERKRAAPKKQTASKTMATDKDSNNNDSTGIDSANKKTVHNKPSGQSTPKKPFQWKVPK